MQFFDYVRILRRRWLPALLPMLVIAVMTLLTQPVVAPPTYVVTMRFAGGLPPEPIGANVYGYDRHYNWLASEYVTRALAQAVETGTFAANISARLAGQAIQVPTGVIRSEYVASYLKVTVSWSDGPQAEVIARAVSDELSTNAAAYWPQLSGTTAAPVRLLDAPFAVAVPAPLRSRFDLPVRAVLALGAGLLLAFGVHALDPYVREAQVLEPLGVPILADIRGERAKK
ncbi:MAG: hypothetical protein NTZ50_15680 [Chloroflexi bacterium]|nr:hypothetical protein [Chloroflexota bacterium]